MKINTKELIFRVCTINDLEDILYTQDLMVKAFKEDEVGYFLPFDKEFFINIFNNPPENGKILGVFLESKMIAWAYLSISKDVANLSKRISGLTGKSADIDGLLVIPEYRGNNIQLLLMKKLEEFAKEMNIDNLLGEISIQNKYSLDNITKLGYEIKGEYKKDNIYTRYIIIKRL